MQKIHSHVLEILRCPVTGGRLRQEGEELVAVLEGQDIKNPRYPIIEGIPVLLDKQVVSEKDES